MSHKLPYQQNGIRHASDTRKPTTCKRCNTEFPSGEQYRAHCSTCKPFACQQCGEKFRSPTGLSTHMKTHRAQVQCDRCDMTFKSIGLLDEHRASEHGVPISCHVCSKVFTCVWSRDRPLIIQHADNPRYACQCGYKFQDEKKLHSHQEDCVLSKPGATRAIKRRFAELSADTDDRNGACTQAFSEARQAAKLCLENWRRKCGLCFANAESPTRHFRTQHESGVA